MKTIMKINKLIFLISVSALYGIQTTQASSTFSSNSTITITIDSITNNTNAGDLSNLDIVGLFEIDDTAPGFGETVTGDGNSSYGFIGGGIDSSITPVNAGDSFSQSFSASGSADNGSVDAYYQALGGLEFVNNSSDSFTIEYSLSYVLDTSVTGDFATNAVALEYFNGLGDIEGYEDSSSATLLNVTDQTTTSDLSFTLNLAASEADMFFADVAINGYAEASAVPVPAAGWLMLTGLIFLQRNRKSVTYSNRNNLSSFKKG
jgi:hypothetical protein